MKCSLFLTLIFFLITTPCFTQTLDDLENEIQLFETKIDVYKKKVDSVQDIINGIKAEEYKKITAMGVPFQSRVIIQLYDDPKPWSSEKICDIPKGDTVVIIKKTEQLKYEVIYKGLRGYISEYSVSGAVNDEILKSFESQFKGEQKQLSEEDQLRRQKEYEKNRDEKNKGLISKYGEATAQKILNGKIWIGMTDQMARESWGAPSDINRSVGGWGVHEQWVYERYSDNTYLYFENGKLSSWQD
jgi:hypothetical protein